MWYAHVLRTTAGFFAFAILAIAVVPGAAQAQPHPCYLTYIDTDPFSPTYLQELVSNSYSECHESASGVSAVGANIAAIGESFVQQQLNIGAGIAGFTTPTGRLRHTDHDGLIEKSTGTRTDAFEVDEGSIFANASYDLPGTYFGGKVRVSGLAGYTRLEQDLDTAGNSTDIDSFVYGGSYLWSQGSFYSMSLIIGITGEADATTLGGAAGGGDYNYDVSGYFTNSVIGYTFDWPGNGWRFDLRGGLGHYDVDTNRFKFAATDLTIKGIAEAWNASITGTLFTIVEVDGGGVMRPYVLASYKNVFDEDIKVKGDVTAEFEQANDYGKVELGFDYVQGILTYGAAGYTEFSADENTFGARLGVSVKLQ
ncbi:autotransporter domain-containing protein [uncultured Hyphomicrobium sp.]|uniref:autotransporter domain-containing protein n=1 Tax=uncultured Hyphomicrobium sp. TaxID=194373 RepID=UPI0025DDACA8|nr:autotransporter domain-containing protein [uncultured Hyphomicrobium sp.]